MRKRALLPLALGLLLILTACGVRRGFAPAPKEKTVFVEKAVEMTREEGAPPAPSSTAWETERMIVRTAQLSLIVEDVPASLARIRALAREMGGYVVSSTSWYTGKKPRAHLTIRVPSQDLDRALERIKELAIKVEREEVRGRDVTEEYTDLEAQLRNLEATEQELRELLRTVREKTGKAEDILAVHNRLMEIRGQIEQIKGRMQYLERTSEMASIEIELIPKEEKPIVEPGWAPLRTFREALSTLVKTMQFIADGLIWLCVYVLPTLIVVLALPACLVWLLWRRRKRAK